jgi:broad specificity phosphatase PhoE
MAVLLMRHGPTQLNNADAGKDRIRGWLNVPLSSEGHEIAQQLAADVQQYSLKDLLSSDLSRAAETAKAVQEKNPAPLSLHPELRPWNLGNFSGQPTARVMPFVKDLVNHPTVSAPGGESFQSFMTRFVPFITPLLHDEELHGVVTHIRNIKAIEALIAGKGELDKHTWEQVPSVDPGGIVYADAEHFEPISRESTSSAGAGS